MMPLRFTLLCFAKGVVWGGGGGGGRPGTKVLPSTKLNHQGLASAAEF